MRIQVADEDWTLKFDSNDVKGTTDIEIEATTFGRSINFTISTQLLYQITKTLMFKLTKSVEEEEKDLDA